jgi:hypothetical protein
LWSARRTCPLVARKSTLISSEPPEAALAACRRGALFSAYLTDDEPPELAFYCPGCAEREFGDN